MQNVTTSVWTYREGIVERVSPRNVVGYGVEASDGSIGKVDEATSKSARRISSSIPARGSSARR